MTIRAERVASLLREEIGSFLVREFSNTGAGFITVTDVQMTADLKIARIYCSVFGNMELRAKTMKLLEKEKSRIRGEVGHKLRLKYIPALQFFQDDTLDEADKINRLIKEIHKNDDTPDTGTPSDSAG